MSCQYILCRKTKAEYTNLQFFPFPNDPNLRKDWIIRCGNLKLLREEYTDQTLYLCENHFAVKQYRSRSNVLKDSAVPYIYGRDYLRAYSRFMAKSQEPIKPPPITKESDKEEDYQPIVSKTTNARTYAKPRWKKVHTPVITADSSKIDLPTNDTETHTLYEIDTKTDSDKALLTSVDIVLITHRIIARPLKTDDVKKETGLNNSVRNSSLDKTSPEQKSVDVKNEDIKEQAYLNNSLEIASSSSSNIVKYVCVKEAIDIDIHDIKKDANLSNSLEITSESIDTEENKEVAHLCNSMEVTRNSTSNLDKTLCEQESAAAEEKSGIIKDQEESSFSGRIPKNTYSRKLKTINKKRSSPVKATSTTATISTSTTATNAEQTLPDEECAPCRGLRNVTTEQSTKPHFRGLKTYYSKNRILTDVCRICLLPITTEDYVKLFGDNNDVRSARLKTMLNLVLPDLDLKLYQNCAVCLKCETSLKHSYHLKLTWAKTEINLIKFIRENARVSKRDADLVIGRAKRGGIPTNKTDDFQNTAPTTENSEVKKKRPVKNNLCHKCGKVYRKIRVHLKNCMKPGKIRKPLEKKLMCEKCGELLYNRLHYISHLETHNIHKCNICKRIYVNKTALNAHIKIRHLRLRERLCHVCGKQSSDLPLHMRTHNVKGGSKLYCCICRKRFKCPDLFKRHNIIKHQNGIKKKTRSKYNKILEKVVCEFCGKFISFPNLRRHVSVVHTKECKFVCNNCKHVFWTEKELVKHRIVVHGFGPEKSGENTSINV